MTANGTTPSGATRQLVSLRSVKFAIVEQGTLVPCSPLLITLSPVFVFDEQHTVLTRDTALTSLGQVRNSRARVALLCSLLASLGQLRNSRIAALAFAILVYSAGFRFAADFVTATSICVITCYHKLSLVSVDSLRSFPTTSDSPLD